MVPRNWDAQNALLDVEGPVVFNNLPGFGAISDMTVMNCYELYEL